MIIYKKNLPTVRQSVREGGGFRNRGKTKLLLFFFSLKQLFTRSVFQRVKHTDANGRRMSVWGGGRREAGGRERKTEVDQQMAMDGWMESRPSVSAVSWADAASGRLMPRFSLQAPGWVCVWGAGRGGAGGLSALFAPRAAVLATTGAQQRLQSHLHKGLEVTASLPSAVLRGDETDRYLHWRHSRHCISLHTRSHRTFDSGCGSNAFVRLIVCTLEWSRAADLIMFKYLNDWIQWRLIESLWNFEDSLLG